MITKMWIWVWSIVLVAGILGELIYHPAPLGNFLVGVLVIVALLYLLTRKRK